MKFLGEKLKRLRELKRWSLADMAKVKGISTNPLFEYETEKNSLVKKRQSCYVKN